jgi:AAA15 family ATPase/GTPase
MIESIEIKNFRCFKDTKIAEFGLVNLLGGMNNSGKTALLEAIYLAQNPDIEIIRGLQSQVRRESDLFIEANPESAWNNFFYQQNTKEIISINTTNNEKIIRKVLLKCNDDISGCVEFMQNQNFDNETEKYIKDISISKKSVLHLDAEDNGKIVASSFIIADTRRGIARTSKLKQLEHSTIFLLTGGVKRPLAIFYEQARFDGKADIVLNAVQIIDNTIEKIEVFNIGEPIIYLTKKDGVRMPLSLFGDAVNTVLKFILRIINNPKKIILIDEIENGIHFTNQEKLWKMLFNLAVEYNVQIFATTHSLEMIKAFTAVAQEFPEKAAYFEMVRSQKTHKIKAIKHNLDTLNFELERNIGIRGDS